MHKQLIHLTPKQSKSKWICLIIGARSNALREVLGDSYLEDAPKLNHNMTRRKTKTYQSISDIPRIGILATIGNIVQKPGGYPINYPIWLIDCSTRDYPI